MNRPYSNPLSSIDISDPPNDLLARCERTIPAPTEAAGSRYARRAILAGVSATVVAAALLWPLRSIQSPAGMPAAFAQTEDAMRQVKAWHVKERFVHLDWMPETPRPLRLSGRYPLLRETWYRAEAGELSRYMSRPDDPGTQSLFTPKGDFWMRIVNWRKVYSDPRRQKQEQEVMQKLREQLRKQRGGEPLPPAPQPPPEYIRTIINAKGKYEQWDTVDRQNRGPNSWEVYRRYLQATITHPERWGQQTAGQVLQQNLSDTQLRQLQVKNRLLRSGTSTWKGRSAHRFEFQIVPTAPREALSPSLPDVFLIAYVDPATHLVMATQEQFRYQGQTERLMFQQREFDYTEADLKRFSVQEFTRGAVLLASAQKR